MTYETMAAIWGAGLATILALIKVWEMFNERRRIVIGHNLRDFHNGNDVTVANPSPLPVMISFWELELRKRKFLWFDVVRRHCPDFDTCGFTVKGHSKHTLYFEEDNYFPWGINEIGEAEWYIRLYVIGKRRPIVKKA